MKLFAYYKQILFYNVFRNYIYFLFYSARNSDHVKRIFNNNIKRFFCYACSFHYVKRIFNSNVKRIFINQY